MTSPLIETIGLEKHFGGTRLLFRRRPVISAVRDVSFVINRGEAVALVGESGSGKTTVGNILLGLETASAGTVLIEGRPLAQISRLKRARLIQPIFQNPMLALNPRRSIEDIIAEPLVVHGIGDAAARALRIARMMDAVGLAGRLRKARSWQLSGGQRQRVAIARALVLGANFLLCDEPTSALDVSIQAQILNLLADLREQFGLGLLFITHDLSIVEFLCERVMVMHHGCIVEKGLTVDVFAAPREDYTKRLLAASLTIDSSAGSPALMPAAKSTTADFGQ